MNRAGHRVIVTNQRGVVLRRYSGADVVLIHSQLQEAFSTIQKRASTLSIIVHMIEISANAESRRRASSHFPKASAANSIVIGDSIFDVEAAPHLGFPTIFTHGDNNTQSPGANNAAALVKAVANSLIEVIPSLV